MGLIQHPVLKRYGLDPDSLILILDGLNVLINFQKISISFSIMILPQYLI